MSVGMITCQWCCSVCSTHTGLGAEQCLWLWWGRLEDAQSAIKRGADPNWKNPNLVSLHQLVHSQCCVSSVVSDHVVV